MTDLSERLELLGLSRYLNSFVSEGFDTWDTLLDITETDLYVRCLCAGDEDADSWTIVTISMSN
jgi:hypothetical protein